MTHTKGNLVPDYDVVVAGHICLDVIPDLSRGLGAFERVFRPGRLLVVGPVTFSAGGPVANSGLALNRLGLNVQLMGKVGDDLYGGALRQIVAAVNPHLADGMVVDPTVATSYTLVINPPEIDRIFLHHPGANDTFVASDVDYDLVALSRILHFGYPPVMRAIYANSGQQLAELFRRAKATGVTTSLDMSLPDPASPSGSADWPAILRTALAHVDIFLPSAEEILFMLRRNTWEELLRQAADGDLLPLVEAPLLTKLSDQLLGLGAKIVVIKLGRRGLYLRTGDMEAMASLGRGSPNDPAAWAGRELWAPAFQAKEVGATGAGDAAIAGFLSALLRGLSPEEAAIAATAVGACNVEATDGLSGILPWPATLARVEAGWPKHELSITAPGWHLDPTQQIWIGSR